jgi:C4-dicarboxylate-specific signal transduction histidine kinase
MGALGDIMFVTKKKRNQQVADAFASGLVVGAAVAIAAMVDSWINSPRVVETRTITVLDREAEQRALRAEREARAEKHRADLAERRALRAEAQEARATRERLRLLGIRV